MIRKKYPLIFAAFLLNFCFCNVTFAINSIEINNKYPDYACEFTGKDSCERFNRKLFVFNLKLNKYILRPLNILWASILPNYGIERLQNAYNNTNYPVRLVGCLLQKDFKSSRTETVRFLTNTTIGFAGLYDPAKTWLKIEPRDEDMEQALAHFKVKKGPYLVLPVVRGNIRDLAGKLLDCGFRPFSYIPIAGSIANAVFSINNTVQSQPLIKKVDETYADPYEIARQYDGIMQYIKNENLDRYDVFKEKTASQNLVKISNNLSTSSLQPDIKLINYNPQTPLIDAMRTAFFECPKPDKSKWASLSVWNKNFNKKIKIASVHVYDSRPNYKYRYILQSNKKSPLAIIYPSIGEGINSEHSDILTKILYDEGYSVIIQGSAFHWEFVKSMPTGYAPGLPAQDASYLRIVSAKIINDIEHKKGYEFDKRIVVGTSFGALTALFEAAQEQQENTLNISKYISVCPPIKLIFALKQVDKDLDGWKNDPSDIKLRAAITIEKVMQVYQKVSNVKSPDEKPNYDEALPFTNEEAELITGFIIKQKFSDVVFAIENCSRGKKTKIYDAINKMSFNDYGQKYLAQKDGKSVDDLDYETSLYSIKNFLQTSDKYKIFHSLDDYFTNPEQLSWLKEQSNKKSLFFSNGSHLGFLYRKEFLDAFINEIRLANSVPASKL